METPACMRCVGRNLDFKYPDGSVMAIIRRRRLPHSSPGTSSDSSSSAGLSGVSDSTTLTPGPLELSALNTVNAPPFPKALQADLQVLDLHVQAPTPYSAPMPRIAYGSDVLGHISVDTPDIPRDDLTPELPSEPEPLDADVTELGPPTLREPATPIQPGLDAAVTFVIKHLFQYSINKILAAPRQMVLENQTPWCHPCLYETDMPRSIQGIFMTGCGSDWKEKDPTG